MAFGPSWQFKLLVNMGGLGPPPIIVMAGADFGGTLSSDFATSYIVPFDATTQLIGTNDGSVLTGVTSVYFGQAGGTVPNFDTNQVLVASSIVLSAGNEQTTAAFALFQVFDPTKTYVCAFYTSTNVNYRVAIAPAAWLVTGVPFTRSARLAFRWGNVNGLGATMFAGGVTTWSDIATPVGSNESSLTTPTIANYVSVASELIFLEKVGIIP